MAKTLDWLRRFLATAVGFLLFGVVGILFKIILYPYAKNYPNQDLATQLQGRKIVARVWYWFVRYLVFAGGGR